jgi:hypothetical protein
MKPNSIVTRDGYRGNFSYPALSCPAEKNAEEKNPVLQS